jgi:pyruvate dehydrogenase E1 component alpha subunit
MAAAAKSSAKSKSSSQKSPSKKTKNASASQNNSRLDRLHRQYCKMLKIRRFEEKAGQLYGMGLIGGFCHLYIGQEAVVVGIQEVLKDGDQIITSYRDHGHMIACDMGLSARKFLWARDWLLPTAIAATT